jgi:hypothetical protein
MTDMFVTLSKDGDYWIVEEKQEGEKVIINPILCIGRYQTARRALAGLRLVLHLFKRNRTGLAERSSHTENTKWALEHPDEVIAGLEDRIAKLEHLINHGYITGEDD